MPKTNRMQYKKTNIKRNEQNKVFLIAQCLLPLGICISPIEYLSPYTPIYSLEYTLPLFVRNRQRVKEKKRERDEGMNNDNNA